MLLKGSIEKIYQYFFTSSRFDEQVMRAFREFFNKPDLNRGDDLEVGDERGIGFFNEWFLYDFELENDHTPLEEFIISNPYSLIESELRPYRDLLENKFGIFEVLEFALGCNITLKDLQTGKKYLVHEVKATYDLEIGEILFGRVGRVDDHQELIGADSFKMRGIDEVVKRSFRKMKFKLTPKEAYEIFKK